MCLHACLRTNGFNGVEAGGVRIRQRRQQPGWRNKKSNAALLNNRRLRLQRSDKDQQIRWLDSEEGVLE